MELWIEWWNHVRQLRPAFTRARTCIWFAVVLAAMCVRSDRLGVTSLIRALGLQKHCYDRLLDFFHSRAIRLDVLTRVWTRLVLSIFKSCLYVVGDRIVLVADGIKVAKTGRKMPAVKKLHQESDNNSKPVRRSGSGTRGLHVRTTLTGRCRGWHHCVTNTGRRTA